jgi:hypothetical protein
MTRIDDAILSEGFLADARKLLSHSQAALAELEQLDGGVLDPANRFAQDSQEAVEVALARLDDGTFGSCAGIAISSHPSASK